MKKTITAILLAAIAATAQGQQPNARLTQLEEYLPTQRINVSKRKDNSAGEITYRISTGVHNQVSGWQSYFKGELSEEEKQQRILTVNSRIAHGRQEMEGVVDYIRTTFASLNKEASESYMYEYHKNGTDTIKYSLAFQRGNDTLYSSRWDNKVDFWNAREAANFEFHNIPHKNNSNGINDYSDYRIAYSHSYSIKTGIAKDDMKPFDGEAFCAHIQPVLKQFIKLKGTKAYPVHWQHDENFEKKEDFLLIPLYGRNQHEFETHPGLTTGTHYIIPFEHEATAKALYKKLDSLAYDYLNKHPEQPYSYEFTSGFKESGGSHAYYGLPHIVKGDIYKGSDEFYFCCKREQDGYYHILTLNSKGVYWVPKDWASLKSYINGEKVYIKGMEPKKDKK